MSLTRDQIDFTNGWWSSLLKDQDRYIAWLKKLTNTEYAGYTDYQELNDKFNFAQHGAVQRILLKIADDELRHSQLLTQLLDGMGINHVVGPSVSIYWDQMYGHIRDIHTAAAVNYFGEDLAAARFEILRAHPQTPSDFAQALDVILPDEIFHGQSLARVAGLETISQMREHHELAMNNLIHRKTTGDAGGGSKTI